MRRGSCAYGGLAVRLVLALAGATAAPAAAQEAAPEDEWSAPAFPDRAGEAPPDKEPPPLPPPPLEVEGEPEVQREPDGASWQAQASWTPPPPPPLDSFGLFGARALGTGRQAAALFAGYPYVGLRYARGFWSRVDLGASLLTFYGMMTEARLDVRWEPLRAGTFSLAVVGGAGGAFFLRSALNEAAGGARWITGRRHLNGDLGLALSVTPADGRGLHPFLDVRYQLAVDLTPIQVDPLDGSPPDFSIGGNTVIRGGLELPLSSRVALAGALGLDLHGRREDAVFLINVSFGVQVSF